MICILLDKDFYNKLIESANSLSEELVAALAAAAVVDHVVVVVVDEGGVGIVRIVVVIAIQVLEQVDNYNLIMHLIKPKTFCRHHLRMAL